MSPEKKKNNSNKRTWGGRWQQIKGLPGGGQSEVFLVQDLKNLSAAPAFLKRPKYASKKAKARLDEEAKALEALSNLRFVPTLLAYSGICDQPYLVMEHIDGDSLSNLVEKNLFSLEDACNFTLGLLHTIGECHEKGIVHRDIKPGNIMIRTGTRIAVLVDFGVGFRDGVDRKNLTRIGEDFGNGFVQHPETLSESEDQRSPVQDITSACSILLYLLTGQRTGHYLNDKKQLPHQRPVAAKILDAIDYSKRQLLLSIFDKAFEHETDKRFQNVAELKSAVQAVLAPVRSIDKTIAEHHEELRAAFGRPTVLTSDENEKVLLTVEDLLKEAHEVTCRELGDGFTFEFVTRGSNDYGNKRVLQTRTYHLSTNQRDFPCTYTITQNGSQVVITTDVRNEPTLKRKEIEHIKAGYYSDITLSAKQFVSANLSRRLRLPNLMPIHRYIYENIRQKNARLIQQEVMSIQNHRDEQLIKGFEELSWLLERHGIDLFYRLGSTAVVNVYGSHPVDMPSALEINRAGSENQLVVWTDGKFEAVYVATHALPGGHVSKQMIRSEFTDKLMKEIMDGKTLSALQD